MLNQTVPMGSVAAYAFLVTALRKRGFPPSSVAVVAGTELLSWNGAALLMFSGGLFYLTVTANFTASLPIISALLTALITISVVILIVTRPASTVNRWLLKIHHALRRIRIDWNIRPAELLVEEIAKSRAIFAAKPWRFGRIIFLQMIIKNTIYFNRDVRIGDIATVGECRPLSKTVRFNVLKVSSAKGAKKQFSKF
jgi:hypothetical protein